MANPFSIQVRPDWEGLLRCLRPGGKSHRVHNIELFLDGEIEQAICDRFDLAAGLDASDRFVFDRQRSIALRRFLGYDYVHVGVGGLDFPLRWHQAADTASLPHQGGRGFIDLHAGPITSWREFESYPWPDPVKADLRTLEWYEKNLPDDMCIIGGYTGHFCEMLTWLMGYETLCLSLYDQPDLVAAVAERVTQIELAAIRMLLQFPRVKAIWGSDDMGFRTGTLLSPQATRQYVLLGHRAAAKLAHDADRPYLLHSCGNLEAIMPDLIDAGVSAKHSFEDVILTPQEFLRRYGQRMAAMGGIDLDFLCRADEAKIRQRVRQTLEECLAIGGYCLGTGNSVANYIPVDAYLTMLDEGRRFAI